MTCLLVGRRGGTPRGVAATRRWQVTQPRPCPPLAASFMEQFPPAPSPERGGENVKLLEGIALDVLAESSPMCRKWVVARKS